ncbi:hypothetical protein RR46_02029 [Papilio xuthus]|uniref:Uncharacterized protein n=1 Tax=Papilio xuthus TaxID=66420 RepID=A0A194QIP9_PAPXU|nr:hypothetical protein RR46_02029 [Papilio xuthus]
MCEVNPHLASVVDYGLVTANLGASPRHAGLTARRQTAEQAAVSALLRPSALAPHDSRFDPTHTHPAFPAVRRSQTVIN